MVNRSTAQRSFWAIVPFDMIAADVSPIDTPIAVTMPGHTRHSSMIGISDMPPPSPPPDDSDSATSSPASIARSRSMPLLEPLAGHRVHPEGGEQLAQDVVRRQIAVLELVDVRADLVVDEALHRIADHLVLVTPLEHRWSPRVSNSS